VKKRRRIIVDVQNDKDACTGENKFLPSTLKGHPPPENFTYMLSQVIKSSLEGGAKEADGIYNFVEPLGARVRSPKTIDQHNRPAANINISANKVLNTNNPLIHTPHARYF
jgi:hypothetical protein